MISSFLFLYPLAQNEKGECPADVVPEPVDMPLEMADAAALAKELRTLLREALPRPCTPLALLPLCPAGALSEKARVQLASMEISLGDRVVVAGQKVKSAWLLFSWLAICVFVSGCTLSVLITYIV